VCVLCGVCVCCVFVCVCVCGVCVCGGGYVTECEQVQQ